LPPPGNPAVIARFAVICREILIPKVPKAETGRNFASAIAFVSRKVRLFAPGRKKRVWRKFN
jgi:hypothetical protein